MRSAEFKCPAFILLVNCELAAGMRLALLVESLRLQIKMCLIDRRRVQVALSSRYVLRSSLGVRGCVVMKISPKNGLVHQMRLQVLHPSLSGAYLTRRVSIASLIIQYTLWLKPCDHPTLSVVRGIKKFGHVDTSTKSRIPRPAPIFYTSDCWNLVIKNAHLT